MSQTPDDPIVSTDEVEIEKALEQARLGDANAFEILMRLTYSEIKSYVIRNLGDEALTEDIVQETYIKAFESLKHLQPGANFKFWLKATANSAIYDYNRKKKKIQQFSIDITARTIIQDSSILRISINEEPLTAHNLSAITTAITDLYTRCWLIQQKRFTDLMDYAQTRDSRFIKEANLGVGSVSHNSPTLIDFLLNAGSIAGGAATLAFALKNAIDAIAQAPLRYEEKKLENKKKILEELIRDKQAFLDYHIAAKKAEAEDEAKQQEQRLIAQKEQIALEREQMLLHHERQKLELEAEEERLKFERDRLEFEKNRITIVKEIAGTTVDQLLANTDIGAGQREMLVHSLIPSLLQLAATDGVVSTVSLEKPKEGNKGSFDKA